MIKTKNKKEIKILRKGGKKLARVLDNVVKMVAPGVSTEDLEKLALKLIEKEGGRPAFKDYAMHDSKKFPTALCTSINNEIVHAPAIPGRILKEGDIIGIDVGMEYPAKNGLFTDMSKTVAVGNIDLEAQKLINVTRRSLELAIEKAKPGNTLNDIGQAVQEYAEKNGFSVVRELVGHGVGYDVHEEPQVPNFKIKNNRDNIVLIPGLVIAIEPMLNMGGWRVKTGKDGFSILTIDDKLSAHFEHTVAITEKGNIVITEL